MLTHVVEAATDSIDRNRGAPERCHNSVSMCAICLLHAAYLSVLRA